MDRFTPKDDLPIFVDLDQTLVRTDLAQELLVKNLGTPSRFLPTLGAMFKGRAALKHHLAQDAEFDAAALPYNPQVLAYLRAEAANGRKIYLATAAAAPVAEKIANHLEMFDAVFASDEGHNLKGKAKLEKIQEIAPDGFEYLGDAEADLPIWAEASRVGLVGVSSRTRAALGTEKPLSLDVETEVSKPSPVFRAMRPHQWAKNLLVLLPLLASHSYGDLVMVMQALLACALFGLISSSIYILNDLLDIEADRGHPTKCKRPFAAGTLLPVQGVAVSGLLMAIGLGAAGLVLGQGMVFVFLLYIVTTTLYSTVLKHHATIDVVVLTGLYTLRVFAGGAAIGIMVSTWLLTFSLFLFYSLALMKRHIELSRLQARGGQQSRGYWTTDLPAILSTGIGSGLVAILTLTLFINSEAATGVYVSPMTLWLIVPLMLFWVNRAWLWALRDKMQDDPVVFALKDRVSQVTMVLCIGLALLAKSVPVESVFQ